jgi:hypothetical protein
MDDCSRAGRAKARAEQRCIDKFNALRQARLALKTGHGYLLSDRALAAQIGVSASTVRLARRRQIPE